LKYIYESPDNGKTIYRRVFGSSYAPRELIKAEPEVEVTDDGQVIITEPINNIGD